MSSVSRTWRTLQPDQRDAWTSVASGLNARTRLGQTGPLTGNQLFCKINVSLAKYGLDALVNPPTMPEFGALAVTGLVITNTGGVIALKLTCPTSPGENTIIRASKPVSQGIARCPDCSVVGMCPTPATGSAVITSLYTAKWGNPPVHTKIFVQANQITDGYETPLTTYEAIVPAAA